MASAQAVADELVKDVYKFMKPIHAAIIGSIAGLVVSCPLYAEDGHGHGGGGRGGGSRGGTGASVSHAAPSSFGGGRSFAAPAMHSANNFAGGRSFAPARSFSPPYNAAPAPAFTPGSGYVERGAVQAPYRYRTPGVANGEFRSPVAGGRSFTSHAGVANGEFRRSDAGGRSFGGHPGVAYGGHSYGKGWGGRNYAPHDISRDWDRHGRHYWNNHYWGWDGGEWLSFDGGYYDPGYYASTAPYAYDYSEAAPAYSYNSDQGTGSLDADVQAALAHDGYYRGPVDGLVGAQTRDAIAAFQSDHGITPTGRINRALLDALGVE